MGCMACNQHGREVLKRKTCPALTLWLSACSPNVHVGERKLHNLQRMWFLSLDVWSRVAGNHDDNQSSFFYVALSQNFANGCIDQSYANIPLVGWYRWRNLSRFRAPPKCGQVDHWPFERPFDLLLALHCGSCHDPKLSTAGLVFASQRLWSMISLRSFLISARKYSFWRYSSSRARSISNHRRLIRSAAQKQQTEKTRLKRKITQIQWKPVWAVALEFSPSAHWSRQSWCLSTIGHRGSPAQPASSDSAMTYFRQGRATLLARAKLSTGALTFTGTKVSAGAWAFTNVLAFSVTRSFAGSKDSAEARTFSGECMGSETS